MTGRRNPEDRNRPAPKSGGKGARTPTVNAPGKTASRRKASPRRERWRLRLYIAGMTPRATAALENLRAICEERLPGLYEIELVDLLENPTLARGDQILAIPTLVRRLPPPVKKIIGDLSSSERVLVGLDLKEPGER